MKYVGMPMGMWALFKKSFRNKLVSVLGYSEKEADRITAAAKPKYKEIIGRLPEFEKATAALNAADRNPYSWNMEFLPYPDGSGYEARFSKCGICTLMKELGLSDQIPAMCRLDYAMSKAGGASKFVREYTLASGGPYCDCGYKVKKQVNL